ncbi:hypothetical protein G9A89_000006 [Geosiphon pyriformis]|nr:hypothetical protein G9A89_000006 [Geosiphon pyriformis]
MASPFFVNHIALPTSLQKNTDVEVVKYLKRNDHRNTTEIAKLTGITFVALTSSKRRQIGKIVPGDHFFMAAEIKALKEMHLAFEVGK